MSPRRPRLPSYNLEYCMIPPRPERFFAALRAGLLGPELSQGEVDGVNAILAACAGWPLAWTAYGLATAYHETAHTMAPIMERGGPSYFARMYDCAGLRPAVAAQLGNSEPGDGRRYCGRGYVQLTGRANYLRAGLADEPERALESAIAAEVLERGMREGWFGRRLLDVLPLGGRATRPQFIAARRTVNGQDRAGLIADYAMRFQDALMAGGCA
jgi:putative chitinase